MTASKQLRLKSAVLENVFCYREVAVDFTDGVCVFSGANGSGKSSLLEAVFFGLFASSTKSITGRDMDQVLRDGARGGSVDVRFTLGAEEYAVYLALKRNNKGDVSTDGAHCSLNCNGVLQATGVKQIAEQVEALLNMSAEDFAHCLYVRQGEVDQLIQATQQERQSIIDRLLRLTKVDEYKQRLDKESRRALRRRQDQLQGALEKDQKAHKELSSANLPSQLAQLEKELAQLEEQRKDLSSRHTQALEERRRLQDTKDRFELTLQKMQALQEEYTQRKAQYDQSEAQLQELKEQTRQRKAEHGKFDKAWREMQRQEWWQALSLSEATLPTQLAQLEQDVKKALEGVQEKSRQLDGLRGETRVKAKVFQRLDGDMKQYVEDTQRINATLEQLASGLKRDLETLGIPCDTLETLDLKGLIAKHDQDHEQERANLAKLKEEKTQLEGQRQNARLSIEKAEGLIRDGCCPTCQQPVTAAALADHTRPLNAQLAQCTRQMKAIESELEACNQRVEQGKARLKLLRDKVQTSYQAWQVAEDKRDELAKDLQEATQLHAAESASLEALALQESALKEESLQLRQKQEGLEEDLKRLKGAQEIGKSLKHLKEQIDAMQKQQDTVLVLRDTHKQELGKLHDSFEELKAQLGELDTKQLEAAINQWGQKLLELETKLKTMDDKRGALNRLHGELKGNYDRLEKLGLEIAQQKERLARLASLEDEVQKLGELYERIRLDLRQQNLAALNGVFNEFFKLMDPSPAYDRIELNRDFDIVVVRTDEQRMSPAILSGGERALINLALRAAIHAVISEAGGVLLPLLFDEPTVFLDQNHVRQLEHLFTALGSRAGQVIVVSHEASLVESADHEYRVSKGADNLGRVEKVR